MFLVSMLALVVYLDRIHEDCIFWGNLFVHIVQRFNYCPVWFLQRVLYRRNWLDIFVWLWETGDWGHFTVILLLQALRFLVIVWKGVLVLSSIQFLFELFTLWIHSKDLGVI